MTSSAIQDVTGISYAGGAKVQGKKSAFDPAEETVGSFQNAMNLAKGNDQDSLTGQFTASKSAQSVSVQKTTGYEYQAGNTNKAAEKAAEKTNTANAEKTSDSQVKDSDTKTEETAKTDDPAVKDAVDEKAQELEKEVVKEIADELDVTEEEVVAAMETLGLTFMDLTGQADMAALVTELTADGDSISVLTDESLFADVVELTDQITELVQNGAEELSGDLSMDFSEIMDMMTEAAEVPVEIQEAVDAAVTELTDAKDEAEVIPKDAAKVTDEVQRPAEEIKEKPETVQTAETTDDKEAVTVVDSNVSKSSQEDEKQTSGDSDQGMTHETNTQPMFSVNDVNAAPETETVAEDVSYAPDVDAQDIINQITRHVRVNNGADFSEVEMSLHPASLGNIHLQVTAREGVITASITAENEAVKDALLVQAMVLKEELNSQGLKIEAVEVTVASHEFEQNMQGENGENAEQMYEEQVKKETRRRIMLSGLEEAEEMLADENLTEAERIRIEMMAKSGSSMDMLA